MVYCVVRGCKHGNEWRGRWKAKGSGDDESTPDQDTRGRVGLSYHRFPLDQKLKAEWLQRCGRADKINVKCARVCSSHFLPSDFDSGFALFKEMMGSKSQRTLIKGAVPSVNLPRSNVNR